MKWGQQILIVCICTFCKWVEAGVIVDRRSSTVARWVHAEITCQYGTPGLIRTDRGTEFRGAFSRYLADMGVRHTLILPQHPRANGMVEPYNGIILSGLRRMSAAVPGAPVQDLLPEVLAGLHFLPRRVGFQPYLLAFK